MPTLEDHPLLQRGNPLRLRRGGLTAGIGGFLAFLVMAHNGQWRFAVPACAALLAIATWGVLDLLGSFDDPEDRVVARASISLLARPIALALGSWVLFCMMLAGAAAGIRVVPWGLLVPLTFLGSVAAVFQLGVALGPWAKDERGLARPLWRRHGFWVIAVAAVLYLPMLGTCSLWDCWETHYGEVSREILSRDDWISLWWVQDGWFWSKPILDFWIQAIAMATLGVHYKPDQILLGADGVASAHPEWAVRAPIFLMTVMAMYLLYKGAAHVFGRRAGLLGALVLASMSDWYFLSHQTMTDMPFVAAMTAAMGLLLLGLSSDEDVEARVYQVDARQTKWRLSGWHLVFGAIVLTALPQILYLVSRNLELVIDGPGPHGFRPHWDELMSGSAGNCGLPGNATCVHSSPAFGAFEPFVQAILWASAIGAVLYLSWGERRIRRLYYLGAWYAAAVATMAKGPAGFALPVLSGFAYVCTTKRWKELERFELVSGLLIILGVAIPWYVAMYVRHGSAFTDRLIFQDMVNRAFGHVHDTNEGDDTSFRFYIWQLGYALFPWTGLAPLGLVYFLRRGDSSGKGKPSASILLVMWFLFAFALFSFMGTKFHHYIFPAVPPVAMLIGVVLDDLLRRKQAAPKAGDLVDHKQIMLSGALFAGALVTALIGRDLALVSDKVEPPGAMRLLQLFTYNYRRAWPDTLDFSTTLTVFAIAVGGLSALLAVERLRRYVVVGFFGLAAVWALWGLDVYMVKVAPHWGQHEIIEAYYRDRKGPEEPLVAYQMNWKGENFYTGNHAPVFATSGDTFVQWVKAQRAKGVKVMYFVTEPGRTGGLRSEVKPAAYREITDRALCNKFVVVRTEL
jgi:4-amino-4-deoxy-L-arabinose transferase-like glycosyltransferase